MSKLRIWSDESGTAYHVRIAPMERRGALSVDWRLNGVVFETPDGKWVGSVPVYHSVALESLTDADLEELLDQAIARG